MSDAASRDDRLEALVVSHTHWDREWYDPAGRFRQRLVRLIDELLDDPGAPFLLDGQAIVLEDYLAVRPERAALLRERLREGSLEAGPWYVLADELIPGGEALVRNLLAGRRTMFALGAAPPPVLYSPDAFGHPAALPTLAREFGMLLAIVWRGYGGARWPSGDTVRWRASDGASVLLFHLPPDGYELASNLPREEARARDRWSALAHTLVPRSTTGLLLLQNGADHHARQPELDRAIDSLRAAAAPMPVVRTTLRDFARRLANRAEPADLPVIEGELRDSYGYAWALQGTFATRAAQKRRNAHIERLLLREVEPWSALARLRGVASSAPLVEAAWRTLLQCHPHDTLCGCSSDEVARAMSNRMDDALAQARGLREDAVLACVGHDPSLARERREEWRDVVLIRNAAPRARAGIAEIVIDTFVADEPVGPGSAPPAPAGTSTMPRAPSLGPGVAVQRLRVERTRSRIDSPRHYPDNDLITRHECVAWIPAVNPYGISMLGVEAGAARAKPPSPVVRAERRAMENDALRLAIADDGRVSLSMRDGSWRSDDLVRFEDVGDGGDLYTHSPIGAPIGDATFLGARLVHRGPLRAELLARWSLRVPASRVRDEGHRARRIDARASRSITAQVRFRLDAGAAFVRLAVAGENRARDHRFRIVFETGIAPARTDADAAFGPVSREPIVVPASDARAERPPRTAPLHRYVTLFGEGAGVTLYSDGLAEYEATDDGAVAVTLVRAVGALSRNDLPERPGHAGWPMSTPAAQCIGSFQAGFAIFPHGARTPSVIDAIERTADDVLFPLRGFTRRDLVAPLVAVRGVELCGEGLAFSTLKESEDHGWIVARCANALDVAVDGEWRFPRPVRDAWRSRLDETPVERIAPDGDRLAFVAAPREVVTVLVRC